MLLLSLSLTSPSQKEEVLVEIILLLIKAKRHREALDELDLKVQLKILRVNNLLTDIFLDHRIKIVQYCIYMLVPSPST